jgi:hypothetical protein
VTGLGLAALAVALAAGAADPARPPEGPEGPRHLVTFGWEGTSFESREGSHYAFQSAALGWAGSWGPRGPFAQITALLPFQARQDGVVYTTRDYYDRRVGGDLLAGWQRRRALPYDAEGEAGAGVHATILYLPAKAGYRDFSAMPVGVGATGVLRWRTGRTAWNRRTTVGLVGAGAFDFWDPLRSNDLRLGWSLRLGLAVGWEGGP